MEDSGPAAAAMFHQLRSNPSRQGMITSLLPVPTSSIAAQYSKAMNELPHVEREQMELHLANEHIRLQQLRWTSHVNAGNAQAAALVAQHSAAAGFVRGNSSPFATSPINVAQSPATSTEFPLLLNHATSTSGVAVAGGIPGLSQGSVHSQPRPASLHNAGSQSPFLPRLLMAPQRSSFFSPRPQPTLTLDSMTTGLVDWSNPTLRHGAASEAARIQREILTRSIYPALGHQYKAVVFISEGCFCGTDIFMQHQQQQQPSQE
jgi:hypothetical protein